MIGLAAFNEIGLVAQKARRDVFQRQRARIAWGHTSKPQTPEFKLNYGSGSSRTLISIKPVSSQQKITRPSLDV